MQTGLSKLDISNGFMVEEWKYIKIRDLWTNILDYRTAELNQEYDYKGISLVLKIKLVDFLKALHTYVIHNYKLYISYM